MSLLEFLQTYFSVFLVIIFFFGLCIGSFLNVVIYRLPIMLERAWKNMQQENEHNSATPEQFDLIKPGSQCPHCQHKIRPHQNIPLFSYLFLKGRCSNCKHKISPQYFFIELLTAIFSIIIAWNFGLSWLCFGILVFTYCLIALVMIDLKTQLLPDVITLPLLWLGLIFNMATQFIPLQDAVIGVIAGYGFLWIFMNTYRLLTKKVGMGHGDFKLLAAIGAWCGWQALPFVIILSALLGTVIGSIYLLVSRQKSSTAIAFGPYLAIAGWLALVFHPVIMQWFALYVGY